jgi:hypothetical protein
MSEVTARDIKLALAKKHQTEFFLTEVKNGPTGVARGQLLIFDAIAIYKSWSRPQIRGYEIKVSRSDFLRDAKYSQYLPYFHEFYFVTPTGMVQRQEVEENIGLIWYNSATGSLTTKKKAVYRDIEIDAAMLLYIIMNRLENDRIPFYSKKAEYWKDWLANKISNRELGWQVKSKLLDQICELKQEVLRLQGANDKLEEYGEILEVMKKHGLNTWYNTAKKLDEALSRPYPRKLDDAFIQLNAALKIINEVKEQATLTTTKATTKAMEG